MFKLLKVLFVFVFTDVCGYCSECVPGVCMCHRVQKRGSRPLKLQSRIAGIGSHSLCVLITEQEKEVLLPNEPSLQLLIYF